MESLENCMPQFIKELDALDVPPEARQRYSYLGGHDIAAIVGASKYAGPYDVYLRKIERIPTPLNAPMDWGLRLESAVAKKYSDQTGHPLVQPKTLFHEVYPFLGGSPDFFPTDDPNLMIEIKTAAEEQLRVTDSNGYPLWGDPGTDEIPGNYMIQVQYYMGLTGRTTTDLAVFFLGAKREFRIYTIKFDKELYNLLIQKGVEFWQYHIEKQVPPPIDLLPTDLVTEWLARKALEGGGTMTMPDNVAKIALELDLAGERRKALEDQEDELKAELLKTLSAARCKKMTADMEGTKFTIGIVGDNDDKGEPYIDWRLVALELSKRLKYPEIPASLIAESTKNGNPRKPYLRGWFQGLRNARKKANATPTQPALIA